ncbi:MAG: SAM-dependent methyltransferase, partial [Myxococcota bacterium]
MSSSEPTYGGIVRASKRPEGWLPPGPTPAGPGDRHDLWPAKGEDLCFLTGSWRIFQRLKGHRYSLD